MPLASSAVPPYGSVPPYGAVPSHGDGFLHGSAPSGVDRAREMGRGVGRRVRSIAMMLGIAIAGAADMVITPYWHETVGLESAASAGHALLLLVLMVVALFHGLLLVRRARFPFATIVVTSVLAVLLPVSPVAALVALSSAIAHDRLRRPWLSLALVTAAVVVCTWRDLVPTTVATSSLRSFFATPGLPPDAYAPLPLLAAILLCVLSLLGAVGIGLLRRARRGERWARSAVEGVVRERDDAVTSASRRAEREQVAREIHDGIGHRLSLLSLDAGALQVAAGNDPELAESAARVRQHAAAATADLRSLVGMLREEVPEPVVTLDELQHVLDDVADSGQPISATVTIADGASASPTLARAVHRIVTELMTNARRHAPGQTLRLRVTGSPDQGVHISASNLLPPRGTPAQHGAHTGLTGIAERAALLGGIMTRDVVDGRRFEVDVHLPWRHAPAGPQGR